MLGADGRLPWRRHSTDSSLMRSALRVTIHMRGLTPLLPLILLGLLLVPVQCEQGLHSLFIPAAAIGVSVERATPDAQASGHHAAHGDEIRDDTAAVLSEQAQLSRSALTRQVRSSAPERPVPSPVTSTTVDHPYTVALDRAGPLLDSVTVHLGPLVLTPLAPDAVAITPERPPPR